MTSRLVDDRPIATTPAALRTVARIVLSQGQRRGLLAFGTADNHLHAELVTDRASAGAFALYMETALRWHLRLGARFERARIRPLHDQQHAYRTFHYAHRQHTRHELTFDLGREGTSVPDLLGLRVLETSLIARVRYHLPRVQRADLVGQLPLGEFDITSLEEGRPVAIDVLAEAAAAALALPDVHGRSLDASRARGAAVHAVGSEVSSRVLGECLGVNERTIRSLRALPADPTLVSAVTKQALLRMAARVQSA